MTSDAAIRLVIVDRLPLVRWALTHLADDAPDVVTVAATDDVTEALEAVGTLAPNVVVVDCSFGDGQGWALARDLRRRHENLGIVLLTTEGSDDVMFRALDSGASSYVSMLASVDEVIAAIRHAAYAAQYFSAVGLAEALRRRHETPAIVGGIVLSSREQQVLELLQAGLSVPGVAATLYVSVSTAKTYVGRIYSKLGANNRAQALMAAVRLGLIERVVPAADPAC